MAAEYKFQITSVFDTEVERDKAYTAFKEALFSSLMDAAVYKDIKINKSSFTDAVIGNTEDFAKLKDEKDKKPK